MTPSHEVESLQRRLEHLAEKFDANFRQRYMLTFWEPPKPDLYRRLRTSAGNLLRRLGLLPPLPPQPPPPPPPPLKPWLTLLKHVDYGRTTRPLLIWGIGAKRDELREACLEIRKLLPVSHGWAPVLVTDVADFAFYSRLNWLVEFIPSLAEPGSGYAERKIQYLAWRYQGVAALPVIDGTSIEMLLKELQID